MKDSGLELGIEELERTIDRLNSELIRATCVIATLKTRDYVAEWESFALHLSLIEEAELSERGAFPTTSGVATQTGVEQSRCRCIGILSGGAAVDLT